MNNARQVTPAGQNALNLLDMSLEINVDIANEDPDFTQGVDEDVLSLVRKHGLKGVLEALHDAAWSAAEMNEETDDVEDMSCFRLRVFGKRLGTVLDTLK